MEQNTLPPQVPMEEFDLSTFAPPNEPGALLELGEFITTGGTDQAAPPSAPMSAPMPAHMSSSANTSMHTQAETSAPRINDAPPQASDALGNTIGDAIDLEMDVGDTGDSSFNDLFIDGDVSLDTFEDLDAGEFDSAMYGM
jgi:hypothetical protein